MWIWLKKNLTTTVHWAVRRAKHWGKRLHIHSLTHSLHHTVHTWRLGTALHLKSGVEGKQCANTCTALLFSFLVLIRATLVSRNMVKENTFLPLHKGEASAETQKSPVNNTTDQDRNLYLRRKKTLHQLESSMEAKICTYFAFARNISQNSMYKLAFVLTCVILFYNMTFSSLSTKRSDAHM